MLEGSQASLYDKKIIMKGVFMKFDWDVARSILQTIEDHPSPSGTVDFKPLDLSNEVLSYHNERLLDRNLIKAHKYQTVGMPYPIFIVSALTLDGHELLDTLRNDTAWTNIKTVVKEKGLEVSFETIKAAGSWLVARTFS